MQYAIIALVLLSSLASAQVESIINFQGQNAELLKFDKTVNVVRPQSFEVDDTCYRDIPYEAYECNNETRYRQECSWIPESQNCWNEPERVCRSVTRHREECHNGPSRRVCHDNPPRQVCTNNPGREVCVDVPSREVCVERPTREVCRTNTQGQNVCQTVGGGQSCQTVGGGRTCRTEGGGQSCHTVPGGQTCNDVPGERICRTVAYQDQDCDTVYRRRCEMIPGRNECRNIPYYEEVCGNVIRYRPEGYACTRTETRNVTTAKRLKGNVQVNFVTHGNVEEFPLAVMIAPVDATHKQFNLTTSLKEEPSILVAAQKRRIKVAQETEQEIILEGDMTIETLDPSMVSVSFPTALNKIIVGAESHIITMEIEGSISAMGRVEIELLHTPRVGKDKKIAELKAEYPSEKIKIIGNKLEINLKGLVQKLEKRMAINLKLGAEIRLKGEILNAKKPVSEKSYEKLKIRQQ